MTRLWWVRHGPTHAKTMVGWSDIAADLSDHARISRLKAHLPETALLVSSDLIRATATADTLQSAHRRLPHLPDLREMHFGDWEMRTANDIETDTPSHIREFWEKPGDIAPPGGESWNDLRARVDRGVAGLLLGYPGQDFIIVSHFGPILTQVQRALGISAYRVFAKKIDNLSVTCLEHKRGAWNMQNINHTP